MIVRHFLPCLTALALACGSGLDPSQTRQLTDAVVDEAATSIGSDGQFVLAPPETLSRPQLTPSQARAFAEIFARDFAPGFASFLEAGHEGPIDFEHLAACGRTFYAMSSFEPLPLDLLDPYHRFFGPWFMVAFCSPSGDRQVSVAVAAFATDIVVDSGRFVTFGPQPGNEFRVIGIPPRWGEAVAISPEKAVIEVFNVTGLRVSRTPQLLAPNHGTAFPQAASWRLTLEDTIEVTVPAGGIERVGEMYYGMHGGFTGRPEVDLAVRELGVADSAQPDSVGFVASDTIPTVRFTFRRKIFPIVFSGFSIH